jgi:UDP-N-acetyl-D-mannosaminuronate dehydrogenase
MPEYSVSPVGERFPLPGPEDYAEEFERLKEVVHGQRSLSREIVVVMGLGFVGAVMAGVVADACHGNGAPEKFVIGMQRPSTRSYWKIPLLNRGISPITAEDPEVAALIRRCVTEKKTLTATFTYDALKLADVVVVDVQCDYLQVAYPIMKKTFRKRGIKSDPLLAHSFERVMPGRNYVASIRDFWRVCSGVSEEATRRVVKFLGEVLHTEEYPLTVLDRPIESETAKVVENSFRATILAFLDEWSLFAERNGVDLIKVIDAIKVRPTHSNIIFPGPGIGGYCLPKDGGLWAYRHIHGFEDDIFKITPLAIDINDTRALHVAQLTRDALRNMGRPIASVEILLLGPSYREDVGDTRYSGSELIVRRLTEMGAELNYYRLKAVGCFPAASRLKGNSMSSANLELIFHLGLFLLAFYVFHDHLIRHISRTRHKIPPAPNMPSPIFFLDVRKLHQNFPRRLSLHVLHQLTGRYMRRGRDKQVHMIPRNMPFQDLHIIGQTDLPNQLSDSQCHLLGQDRLPVLRDPYEMQFDVVSGMRRGSVELHAAIILK